MLGLVPLPWKLGAVAALVGILCVSSYVLGRKHVRGQMDALRQSYEVAAAQAAGREAERVRQWTNAVKVASEKYDERAKIADSSFDASLDRLRQAYASVRGVRFAAPVAGECPSPSGPTGAELLGMGETLARLVREADRDRAALASCVAAWPR
jgi:hypothetical protein